MKQDHLSVFNWLRRSGILLMAVCSMFLTSCAGAAPKPGPEESAAAETSPVSAPEETETAGTAQVGEGETVEEYLKAHAEDESVNDGEPVIPEDLEKIIIGKDDRITINNTSAYPYSTICYMVCRDNYGNSWTGTGFMTAGNHVVTAAHCVWNVESHRAFDSVTFYFGYKNQNNYYYVYNGPFTYWVGTTFPSGTYSLMNIKDDYAVIQFPVNIEQYTGSLGFRTLSEDEVDRKFFYVAGYRDGILKQGIGRITDASESILWHNADTLSGNSGCPMFDSQYMAVGINVAHDNTSNYCRRMDYELYDFLDKLPKYS